MRGQKSHFLKSFDIKITFTTITFPLDINLFKPTSSEQYRTKLHLHGALSLQHFEDFEKNAISNFEEIEKNRIKDFEETGICAIFAMLE